jgi:SAM-dependent methyltransferase
MVHLPHWLPERERVATWLAGAIDRAGRRLPSYVKRLSSKAGLTARLRRAGFTSSKEYWEQRYQRGGNSGSGSYGRLAQFKAEILNDFVAERGVQSVIEFGCGDGHQLSLASYPAYTGFDVSRAALERCRERFAGDASKTFKLYESSPTEPLSERADLALSLDVIYHLVEDATFDRHMRDLFSCARRFVAIYASDFDQQGASPHVRHRQFSRWVAEHEPDWVECLKVPNRYPGSLDHSDDTSFADFHFYARR